MQLRRAPLQSRGQATFDHILDATSQLLDELGLAPYLAHGTLPKLAVPVMYQGAQFDWGMTPTIEGPKGAFAQSPAPLTLAIPIATTITDVSAGAPELLQRVTISFTGLPPGTVFSAGSLLGNVLTLDVGAFAAFRARFKSERARGV